MVGCSGEVAKKGSPQDGGVAHDASAPVDGSPVQHDLSSADLTPPKPQRQSLIWVWLDYANSLDKIAAHASSFTQVSPAMYQVNYNYQSGAAQLNGDGQFSGLSAQQVSQKIHAAGLACIPLVYGGAGNFGTDQGIQNILNDTPAGAQQSFITSMVTEAMNNNYDGYNLDWEVSNTGHSYSGKLVSFLSSFRAALNAHGMTLSIDLGGWYVLQCSDSNGDGLVDLTALGTSVDWAIMEDYSGALGTLSPTGCPSQTVSNQGCANDFASGLQVMCDMPPANVSIGLISPSGGNGGTNGFAGDALNAVTEYGFSAVAVWPDDAAFLNDNNISPPGSTWYSLLAAFLKQ
jgi:hypothetical protein